MADTSSSPIATLFPGYFALVMATGIVAIGDDEVSAIEFYGLR